jgi:hypothetical protein
VIAKRAVSANPDAVKQSVHHLVALMEELLTFNLHTASLLVALTEEPLASGPHHAADRLVIVHHAVGRLVITVLQTESLDTKRSSVSLIKITMEN